MSYDISTKLHARASLADRAQMELADRERLEFLRRLDAAEDVNVNEWEADFIGNFIKSPRGMTPKQRECVDEMRKRYEHQLPQWKAESRKQKVEIPDSLPGQCGYFVRGDAGGQVRCGKPASHKTNLGLELCQEHWDTRVRFEAKLRELKTRRSR